MCIHARDRQTGSGRGETVAPVAGVATGRGGMSRSTPLFNSPSHKSDQRLAFGAVESMRITLIWRKNVTLAIRRLRKARTYYNTNASSVNPLDR